MYGIVYISRNLKDVLGIGNTSLLGLGVASATGLSDYVKADLTAHAEPFVAKTLNNTNIKSDFGEGKPFQIVEDVIAYDVETPVGPVILTTHTWNKLATKGRVSDFGLIKPTLTRPLYVLQDTIKDRLIFVKTFKQGNKVILFYSVVGDFGNVKNGSITNFNKESYKDIIEKIESGNVRYIAPELRHDSSSTAPAKNIPLVAVGSLLHGYTNIDKKSFSFDEKKAGLGKLPPMQSDSGNAFDIDYVPLSQIYTDEKNFQNRADKYSEKSVKSIINAVDNDAFNWFAFDPVTLWLNPTDGKYYVLSGHSRTQAFRELANRRPRPIVDGLSFDRIPAKIFKGTFEDAKYLALNSNALGTPETLTERADYYRNQRSISDKSELKNLKKKALRENNGQLIWDLSYLPSDGMTMQSLKSFKVDGQDSMENFVRLATIAQWIGKAFQIYKGLSSAHDQELLKFLLNGGYGSKSGQYFSFSALNDRLEKLYKKNVVDDKNINRKGEYTKPFQIAAYQKTDSDLEVINDLKKTADKALKDLKASLKNLRDNNADRETIYQVATPYFNGWLNAQYDWWQKLDRTPVKDDTPGLFGYFGLGKPTIKLEFEDNAELLAFQETIKNAMPQISEPIEWNSETETFDPGVSGLTVNDKPADIFNCPESQLQTRGYKPTYIRLNDYSHLIDSADGRKTLKGYGFESATLDELVNACRYYPQVAALAAHLKDPNGDPLQTAFNDWHWLHTNIRYDYDTPGEEEIRTPARVWRDRFSGVDCDCLAVMTACLLINQGFHPCFEIVAFNNEPTFSHIYVNLDGAAIDRVLPVFLARPDNITKTQIMEIPVYSLSGIGGCRDTLSGVYSSTLAKIQSGTATGEDNNDFRKTQVLVTLRGIDDAAYSLAALLMPHVVTIADDGTYYFDSTAMANLATKLDDDLRQLMADDADPDTISQWIATAAQQIDGAASVQSNGGKDTIVVIINPQGNMTRVIGQMVKASTPTLTATTADAITPAAATASPSADSPLYATTPAPIATQPDAEPESGNTWLWIAGISAAFGIGAALASGDGKKKRR